MSSLVDVWTAELAKLRDKTRAALSSPAAADMGRAGEVNEFSLASEPEELFLGYPALRRGVRTNPWSLPVMPRTEAAVTMLVDCFSP